MRNAHPALFQPDMVRAILDGRKTMTRRLAHRPPCKKCNGRGEHGPGYNSHTCSACGGAGRLYSPWRSYKVGDLLWVRESFRVVEGGPIKDAAGGTEDYIEPEVIYFADCAPARRAVACKWKPSIHLPRSLSRLTLEIVSHKIEHLTDISEEDALAEGVTLRDDFNARESFEFLWKRINGSNSWREDPEVVAVGFRVHRCNVDKFEG